MTVASEITRIEGNISAAYTAADAKGATMPATENSDNLATCIASIPSGGGTPSGTTDVPLTRVTDDNNNEIGTWFCNFEDANGNMYKVVLLDAQYRNASAMWCTNASGVTDMAIYQDLKNSNVWEAKETATANTQLILDYCTASGYTSSACSHCRSQSFTIGGVTYQGQMPNMLELFYIGKHYNEFDVIDSSASTHTSTNFSSSRKIWSSTQYATSTAWTIQTYCNISSNGKNYNTFICPVLEIPLS